MPEPFDTELDRLVLILEREAAHWTAYPDYFTVKRGTVPEGTTQKEAYDAMREELAGRVNFHRGTHTDIVLRDVAARLRRLKFHLSQRKDGE